MSNTIPSRSYTKVSFPEFSKQGQLDNFLTKEKGATIFDMGESLDGVYIVNTGTVKLTTLTETGEEHVIRFCLEGEVFGIDALEEGFTHYTATAIEHVSMRFISFNELLNNMSSMRGIVQTMVATMNKDNQHLLMLSQCTAQRRLARFIVDYYERLPNKSLSSKVIPLPMKRHDIALFLGVTIETVCRELTRFSNELKIIRKNRREIEILNLNKLRLIAFEDDVFNEKGVMKAEYQH